MRSLRLLPFFFLLICALCTCTPKPADETFADVIVDPAKVQMFWKGDDGKILKSIGGLKSHVERGGKKLTFAMNGGMYQEDQKPLGLFIQDGSTVTPLNTREAQGNFYLKPNGVFGIGKGGTAFLVTTDAFRDDGYIAYATQSGPMLIVDGKINDKFDPQSENLNIRNGVCVLDDGRVLFAISKRTVTFYEFAAYFQTAGCRNALYLDGFVSRMYAPDKGLSDLGGDFGVIIAVVE